MDWADVWLKKLPFLQNLLKSLWSLAPSAASAERNWSLQDFIFSSRRVRLNGVRGTKLVSIYWNLRALDMYEELKERTADKPDVIAWRLQLIAREDFPHKEIGWKPNSNYGSSAADDAKYAGMHGDELGGDDEEEDAEDTLEEAVPDWAGAATAAIRAQPAKIPDGLRKGDAIVVYFFKPYSAWFEGVIDKVDGRCQNLPVFATFADGPARLSLDAELYGVEGGKQWALLRQPTAQAGASVHAVVDLDDEEEDDQ